MWRLGGALLLLIPAIFSHFVEMTYLTWCAAPESKNWEWIEMEELHMQLLHVLSMPIAAGMLAIMAGIGICKRRWWSRIAWWTAAIVSGIVVLLYLLMWVGILLEGIQWYFLYPRLTKTIAYIGFFISVACVVLLGIAVGRYLQFRKSERARRAP